MNLYKEVLFIRFTVRVYRVSLSICVCVCVCVEGRFDCISS